MTDPNSQAPLLSIQDLQLTLRARAPVTLLDGVSFDVRPGEVVGVVGESGCGKSITALSLLRLTHPSIGISRGKILFQGEDIAQCSDARMRKIRGGEISMIFQEPMTSLNPVFTVGEQIVEALLTHQNLTRSAARQAAIEFLSLVGIPSPQTRLDNYPHQMSGGMRQRVMIAMALACKPKLLIADEPTTALDVTIQAQILDLLKRLRAELGMAVLIITHDLGVVAELADSVVVMYAGRVVEKTSVAHLFERPMHPYTEGLMASIAPMDYDVDRLPTIGGAVPSPQAMPAGCRFAPRCRYVMPACSTTDPALAQVAPGHWAACLRHTEAK
jgi:oligopeptide/dipeptide ABC transporter ATP-binding protein